MTEKYQEIIDRILLMYKSLRPMADSKALDIMSRKLYQYLPEADDEFISLCNELVCSNNWILYQMMTLWIKKRDTVYEIKYFSQYENWLINHTNSWGACDQYCYRVLNPMVEKFPCLFEKVKEWSHSEKIYVKRASAVCLMRSTQSFVVDVPFEYVKIIADILIKDEHIHVQKGIGWLLKYTYLSYPNVTVEYLKENKKLMSRTTYRYALEKMPKDVRADMMCCK